jgi:hypothetical protein
LSFGFFREETGEGSGSHLIYGILINTDVESGAVTVEL